MLQGRNLIDLAKELQRIDLTKKDIVAPIAALSMTPASKIEIRGESKSFHDLSNWSHQQLSSYTEVPKAYYDRLRNESPSLLATNVNHGFAQLQKVAESERKPERRLVRLVDNKVRAFLSSRYRILDSSDMLGAVMPLMSDKKMEIVSCELTEKRVYLKAISKKLETEVKKGDVVQYGLMISSSDVGCGSVKVEPFIYRLVCLNGMVSPDSVVKKYHVGKNLASLENSVQEILTDETKEANDSAFWMTVRDVVANSMKQEVFETVVDRLRIAANEPIKNLKLDRVVELTSKSVGITGEKIKQNILQALINGGDLSRWGLVNAFTHAAHATEGIDYDTSTELERAGGKVLELSNSEWRTISATA